MGIEYKDRGQINSEYTGAVVGGCSVKKGSIDMKPY